MSDLSVIGMILSGVVAFVAASALWYVFDLKQTNELENRVDSLLEETGIQKNMIKSLLRDNKRLVATLNHYNIKKVVKEPVDVFEGNVGEGTDIYFGGEKI